MGIGIEMAGVPIAVQGLFIRASPVEANPLGAGPVAAGTRITGVVLYRSAMSCLLCEMNVSAS